MQLLMNLEGYILAFHGHRKEMHSRLEETKGASRIRIFLH